MVPQSHGGDRGSATIGWMSLQDQKEMEIKTFGDTHPCSPSVLQQRNQLLVRTSGMFLGQPAGRTVWPPY